MCASLAPDSINGYFFVIYVAISGILGALSNQSVFDSASCLREAASLEDAKDSGKPIVHLGSESYSVARLPAHCSLTRAAAVFAGLSGGSLLVLLVTMLANSTSRRWPVRAAAWAIAICVVHFAYSTSPAVCVRALGGFSAFLRPQQPMEYIFWFCTLVPEAWAVACLARQPLAVRIQLVAGIVVLLSSGIVSSFTDIFPLWSTMLVVSCIAHVVVTVCVLYLLRKMHAQSKDGFTRKVVAITAPILTVVWCAYPVWWLFAQFSLITSGTEQVGWQVLEFCAKFALAAMLMCGNFIEQARLIEDELAVYEEQRRRADDREEAKRLFVRYILHEIRVPLQGGQLAIQELQLGLDAGELIAAPSHDAVPTQSSDAGLAPFRSAVDTASASISTVGKLLDDFLSLAKIEDGRMTFEPCDVPLEGLLRESTVVFTNALRAKGLQLRLSLAPDAPTTVFVDGARVRQIISNFLSNAIKFSPLSGEIVVRVSRILRAPAVVVGGTDAAAALVPGLSSRAPSAPSSPALRRVSVSKSPATGDPRFASDEILSTHRLSDHLSLRGWTTRPQRTASTVAVDAVPFLLVSVSDSGPGISADEILQLFQPYAQLHAGVNQKGLGTGLGLAICKGIAELMGGAVGVFSQPGAGATFWVEIPLSAQPATSAQEMRSATQTPDSYREHISAIEVADIPGAGAEVLPRANSAAGSFGTSQAFSRSAKFVNVESTDRGNGSIHQPIVDDALIPGAVADSVAVVLSVHSASDGATSRQAGLRIVTRAVVVDDVRSNRELFARLLRRSGADIVFTAEHGLDALTQLRAALLAGRLGSAGALDLQANRSNLRSSSACELDGADALIDVWFIDGNMPVMDGLELARRLRGAGVCAPIVAVTGNALAEDQAAFRQGGADAVLTKPLTASRMQEGLASIGLSFPRML